MGELINILGEVRDTQIPGAIARDAELAAAIAAAIAAHIAAGDPHSQYIRKRDSFEDTIQAPINFGANTWQPVGNSRIFGEQGAPTFWDIVVYFEYVDGTGATASYFQYCGGASLAAIYWNADLLTNEGVFVAFEAHNEADFSARLRFGRGQSRKVEIKLDRSISIATPGFMKIIGVRKI